MLSSQRPPTTAVLLVLLAAAWSGCTFGDLNLRQKRCDATHVCPDELVCVQVPDGPDTRIGICFSPLDAPGCEPDSRRCSDTREWVEICEADAHSRRVDQICANETSCNPDTHACAHACLEEGDCDSGATCDLGTGLCRPYSACQDPGCSGLCVGEVCVPLAPADTQTATGSPELDCFQDPPSAPPDSPDICELTGRVNLFPAKNNSDLAIGLTVQIRENQAPYTILDTTTVYQGADQAGYYTFEQLQTNRGYLLETSAGTSDAGEVVVSTLNTALHLRADMCTDGIATRGISAMRTSTFETFSAGTIEGIGTNRALLVGQVLDCNAGSRRALGNVTIGLRVSPPDPGRIYYLADEDYLFPDLDLQATSVKGYYAAAGLPATRNAVGFAAKQGTSNLSLGSVSFYAEPGMAVIADLPLPSEQLP